MSNWDDYFKRCNILKGATAEDREKYVQLRNQIHDKKFARLMARAKRDRPQEPHDVRRCRVEAQITRVAMGVLHRIRPKNN
jgi:hypothetical protein